jgi:hypothetical protein
VPRVFRVEEDLILIVLKLSDSILRVIESGAFSTTCTLHKFIDGRALHSLA